MYRLHERKRYSQNFLYSRKLTNKLIARSSIGKNDHVLEIGPGKGILTEKLIEVAASVEAIEIDRYWVDFLKRKFSANSNILISHSNFLNYSLPKTDYKVFANIPFSIEGKIIRKLIDAPHPPQDCYLIIMKELGNRLAAQKKENLFSVVHKPWFSFDIVHHFQRTDFEPKSNVDAVLFRFTKQTHPFIPVSEKAQYEKFVTLGYGHGQSVLKNLSKKYNKWQIKKALTALNLQKDCLPGYLSVKDWVALFQKIEVSQTFAASKRKRNQEVYQNHGRSD